MSCRDGAGKSKDSCRVDGWTVTGLDAGSPMRQEDHVSRLMLILDEHVGQMPRD